jgi:hypothetical protein
MGGMRKLETILLCAVVMAAVAVSAGRAFGGEETHPKEAQIREHFKKAQDSFEKGDLKACEEALKKVLELKPSSKLALELREEAGYRFFMKVLAKKPLDEMARDFLRLAEREVLAGLTDTSKPGEVRKDRPRMLVTLEDLHLLRVKCGLEEDPSRLPGGMSPPIWQDGGVHWTLRSDVMERVKKGSVPIFQAMKRRADGMIKTPAKLDNNGRHYMPTYAAMYLITQEEKYANKAKEYLELLSKTTIENSWTCLEYIPVAAIA